MVMVPPEGRSVCVVKATVVTAVVACSAFWSAAASVSAEDWTTDPIMAGAFTPVERAASALDDILKPAVVAA